MTKHLSNWESELLLFVNNSKALCFALFNTNKELVYANQAMKMLFKSTPQDSLINPTLDKLIEQTKKENFNGIMTIGSDIDSNTSINAMAFQKQNEIMILGEVDTATITRQNISLAKLNREVNNLQRDLIKEKTILKSTNAKLEELNKSQNIILGTAAHDLRNPIGTTFSLADLITENPTDYSVEDLIGFINIIKNNSEHTLNLLNSLLDFSSIQTGKIELSIQQYNYNKIIEHCIEMNQAFANNKEIRINFTPNTAQNICNIEIDPIRIEQVVSNLLSNAIKYSNKETEIKIKLSCDGNEVKTEVIDNGIGIPENEIDSLFQPFHITSNKSTGGEKSTGLGLAITKKVIDLHNGKIGVLSEKGKGSNFYFTLPKKQNKEKPVWHK